MFKEILNTSQDVTEDMLGYRAAYVGILLSIQRICKDKITGYFNINLRNFGTHLWMLTNIWWDMRQYM